MSVRETARRQYVKIVNDFVERLSGSTGPPEGWVKTIRGALGMSAPQLARRLGVTKAAVYQSERRELDGEVTIKHMEAIAKGMGCRFAYAIIPETSIDEVVRTQALRKSEAIVSRAHTHMALEQQALPDSRNNDEIVRLAEKMVSDQPAGFWDEP